MNSKYYNQIGDYYDKDAVDFEHRYWKNDTLQRIRQSFREHVRQYKFTRVLEIGFGPGFDLVHFAQTFPEASIRGLDISAEMVRITNEKILDFNLSNAISKQGSVEDIESQFPGERYDMIYVFFGALNTVDDLSNSMAELERLLLPGGNLVLTFVNKWYVGGILIELLKGRFRSAFDRLKKVWGGYSSSKFLASKCYSSKEVKLSTTLKCKEQRGYSIFFPAWYYGGIHRRLPNKIRLFLWFIDSKISRTKLGTLGEYMLYDFQKKS
jgi:ubiquinone/menaquinone biosynthesis C-methylase UbiE|tara:strand:- start:3348 stop:4148 length:801 start_codon:yes stop_codon:yes gene_type:complete